MSPFKITAVLALACSACTVDAGDDVVASEAPAAEPQGPSLDGTACTVDVKGRFSGTGDAIGTLGIAWYSCSHDARASLRGDWWLSKDRALGYFEGEIETSHGSYTAAGDWTVADGELLILGFDASGRESAAITGEVRSFRNGIPAIVLGVAAFAH